MDKMNILITGGNGYIAKSLEVALSKTHNVMSISRFNFDLTNSKSTNKFFQHRLFDAVIHCAVKGGSRLSTESWKDMDDNLKMYYNLLENAGHYDKFIHFGSGAELFSPNTPYGLSKLVITKSMLAKHNYYNLRIFGVFDENELETRFIKANLKRYINKQSMIIHQDKYMDFIYMKDLVSIVNAYLINDNLPKTVDCSYENYTKLSDIANHINSLSDHKVEIILENQDMSQAYIGKSMRGLDLNLIGLKQGINEVYKKLTNEQQ